LLGAHPTDAEWVTRAERFPMIFVECQCGKTYVIAVQHAGRKVICRHCGARRLLAEPDGKDFRFTRMRR